MSVSTSVTLQYGAILTGLGGGLALFLYGMRKMTDSLKVVAGGGMKKLLARLTTNRFTAALAGALVTAVIQSSSITTVLVVGFISAGLINFSQSLGIIMGANIGTTITAQIIAFKVTQYALLIIAVGFFLELLAKSERIRQYGVMIMGLGILFFGMELMSDATNPLRQYQPFVDFMSGMKNPFMGILAGMIFTALVQSSSATTGIVIVLAGQGFISLDAGIALVLGANIGTCVTALLSTIGKPREAVQTATAHVVFNVLGVLLWIAFIPQFADIVRTISPTTPELSGIAKIAAESPRQIANAHTVFNFVNMLIFIWLTGPMTKLVFFLVPERKAIETKEIAPQYLDHYFLNQPDAALDRAKLELDRLGKLVFQAVKEAFSTIISGKTETLSKLRQLDESIDVLHGEIVIYLGKISLKNLIESHSKQIHGYIAVVNYLENIGDLVETNIVAEGNKILAHNIQLSIPVSDHLKEIHEEVCRTLEMTLTALSLRDTLAAQKVFESKAEVKQIFADYRIHIVNSLQSNSAEQMLMFRTAVEIATSFERVYILCRRIASVVLELDGVEPSSPVK